LSKAGELDFSILSNLPSIDHGVTCFFPCLNTSFEAFYVLVSLLEAEDSLTGSTRFFGSGTVKNDLLIFCQRGQLGLELVE